MYDESRRRGRTVRNFWNHRQVDLDRELRARRPRARSEFVETLAAEMRNRPAERSRVGRVGLAFAMSGLILVVLASFGGIGYAASAVSHAVKKPTAAKHVANVSSPSAAQAQYGGFTPPNSPPLTPPATTPSKPSNPSGGTTGGGTTGAGSAGGAAGGNASSGSTGSGTEGTTASSAGTTGSSSNLPFTGLALWVPLGIGLGLIAMGLVLRTRGRRQDSGAQF
jgi:hypothetical protein